MSKSIKVLRDQKEEYTEHLFELLNEPMIHVFKKIYDDVLKSKECTKNNVLKLFQKEMATTPEWNQTKVKKIYDSILSQNKCGYFPELIKTVYMLTLKIVLLGIPQEKRKNNQIRIPSPESFVHRCLVHVARELWKRPYLLYHESRSIDCQQNIHECELIIRKKLKAVIRETIPLEWVINEFDNINSGSSESEPQEEKAEAEEEEAEAEAEDEESEAEDEEESEEEEESEAEDEESEAESEAEDEESEAEDEEESEEEEESEAEEDEDEEESEAEEEKENTIIEEEKENTIIEEDKENTIIEEEENTIIEEEENTIIEEAQPPVSELEDREIIIEKKHKKKKQSLPVNAFF